MSGRRLHALWVLFLVLAFAAPLAPAWALCESKSAAVEACPDSDCDPSDCPEGTAVGGCAQCGQLGKILAATTLADLILPPALPWVFSGISPCAQEGFVPVIDRPPRDA
jgi:hypothetical protein